MEARLNTDNGLGCESVKTQSMDLTFVIFNRVPGLATVTRCAF